MPKLSKEKLREHVRERKLAPVYVLYGAEAYLRESAAKSLANTAFGENDLRDFNETSFSLNEPSSIRDALAAADQLPMMAEKRVVRITDVRVAATGNRDTLKEEYETLLGGYLANPSPHSVVIFSGDELNGNRKITKLFEKHSTLVEFQPLDDKELFDWIARLFKESGMEVGSTVVRHLTGISGSNLVRLSNDVKKLAAAALPNGLVTEELVDSLVARTRLMDNFALSGHLVAGRTREAVSSLHQMLDDGAEPLMLLGLLGSNYRRLLIAKDLMESGSDRSEVARAVKLRYNDQEPFLAAARRAKMSQLTHAISRLAEADISIKSSIGGGGPAGAKMQIEMLVCELAAST